MAAALLRARLASRLASRAPVSYRSIVSRESDAEAHFLKIGERYFLSACNFGPHMRMGERYFSSGRPLMNVKGKCFSKFLANLKGQIAKRSLCEDTDGSNPVARRIDLLTLENKIDKAVHSVEKAVHSVEKEFNDFALKQGNEVAQLRNEFNSLSKAYNVHYAQANEVISSAHLTWIKNTLWAITFVVAMFYRYESLLNKSSSASASTSASKKDDDAIEVVEPTSNFGE